MPFTIIPGLWYAWQMLPGYVGEFCVPYHSPIRVNAVIPAKTGKGLLKLDFWNAGYAEGVQNFTSDLRVLFRGEAYLVARIMPEASDRCAVVSRMEFGWLDQYFPHLMASRSEQGEGQDRKTNVQQYLNSLFKS